MPVHYYQNCRCPACQHRLDEVPTTTVACPMCNKPLDPHAVWSTRTYPGILILPRWLTAFGWPLALILAGVAFGATTYFTMGVIYVKGCALLIAPGIVMFFVKFLSADDA